MPVRSRRNYLKSVIIACLFVSSAGGFAYYAGKRLFPGRRLAIDVAAHQRCPHFLWITLGIVFTLSDKTRRFCRKACWLFFVQLRFIVFYQ
jgi:hypothetical protein